MVDGYRAARHARIAIPAPGHRVVVRYLLPSGEATDALGNLLSADAATVVVDGKRGIERIAVADILAAKEVPPGPGARAPGGPRPPRTRQNGADD